MDQVGLKFYYDFRDGPGGGKTIAVNIAVGKSESRQDFITSKELREKLAAKGFKAGESFGGFFFVLREPEKRLDVYSHVPIQLEGAGLAGLKEFRGMGLGTEIEKIVYQRVRKECGQIGKVRFYQITKPMLNRLVHLGHSKQAVEEGLTFAAFEGSIRKKRLQHLQKYRRKIK